MSIVSDDEVLEFLDVEKGYFNITSRNDVIILTYSGGGGSTENVDIPDATYEGTGLAAAMETAIDSAFTITSTVAYSSSTRKFSITAPAGETFAYTHSGSDIGLTIGFIADKSAALTLTSDDPAGDPVSIITGTYGIRDAIEDWVQNIYCLRTFESTAFSEYHNGNGESKIFLDNYPVTDVTRVAMGRVNAMRVRNTNESTSASVGVTTTGLVLTLDGTADSTDVTFATNTTMTAMVATINGIGSGWEAVVEGSYGAWKSSELLLRFGASAIDSTWVYLSIPEDAEDEYEVYPDEGIIYLWKKFTKGHRNIYVQYTAGYSSTTMPKDLKLGIKILIQSIYQKRAEQGFGLTQYTMGSISNVFRDGIPKEAEMLLFKYRRIRI